MRLWGSTLTAKEAKAWVDQKAGELRSKTYEELRMLPSWQAEEPADERYGCQGVYRDTSADGRVRIVVQASGRARMFWPYSIWVNGFWISPGDEIEELRDEDRWEFV